MIITVSLFFTSCNTVSNAHNKLHIKTDKTAAWWVGDINKGVMMPFNGDSTKELNLVGNPDGNQIQPLLLSNLCDVVWCENAPKITFGDGELTIDIQGKVEHNKIGNTLKEAYEFASKR